MQELIERYSSVPPNQRYAMVGLLIVALLGGHYYFIFTGQELRLEDLTRTYNKKQGVKNEKQNVAENREAYEAKLSKLQEQLDEARAQLPDRADVPQLLAQLGSKARQTGLAIEAFEPGEENNRGFFAEIPFKVTANGSYHEVALFIDSVAKLDRIINVSNLKMASPKDDKSKVIVHAFFDVTTYRFTTESGGGQ